MFKSPIPRHPAFCSPVLPSPLLKSLLCSVLCFSAVSACAQVPNTLNPSGASLQAERLAQPLGNLLDQILLEVRRARTPDEAEQLAMQVFQRDVSKYLLQGNEVLKPQLQVQAQWTVNQTIQMQIQVQIATRDVTTQAQRQFQFSPGS